jgi:large subunit ribosomal protein L7/L12
MSDEKITEEKGEIQTPAENSELATKEAAAPVVPVVAPAPKAEEKKEPEKEVEIPAEFKDLITKIETLSVLKLAELVKVLEKKFGVSASAMAVAVPVGGGGEGDATVKDSYTVILKAAGDQKINVIKAIKEIMGIGLTEAKALVDSAPKPVKADVKKEDANEIKQKLEAVGAVVELQ